MSQKEQHRTKSIVALPGDGIGVEVTRAAMRVLQAAGKKHGLSFEIQEFPVGGAALDTQGTPIKFEVIEACQGADAVFLGAVGGPKWDNNPKELRPEIALLTLRKELDLFTNFRPVKVYDSLVHASTLKPEVIRGVDVLVVRELTGGIYFGKPRATEQVNGEERAIDTMVYRTSEIERIARVAFEAARLRRQKVTSVDKANILATSQLWRKTVARVARNYPEVKFEHMLVDNCAMQIVRAPAQFDVILTENMFGDILSDEASMLTGSLGMLPSASLGHGVAMYEPVHGSAPDIAGQDRANPIAAIGSIAMMFRYSFELSEAAAQIEQAISSVLESGFRCADFAEPNQRVLGTTAMTDKIIARL